MDLPTYQSAQQSHQLKAEHRTKVYIYLNYEFTCFLSEVSTQILIIGPFP